MKAVSEPISFEAVIERLAPQVPRFVVYSGDPWGETATFTVDVSLNGTRIGLRNLVPWKQRGWSFGLSQPMCRKAAVDTGDRVRVVMRRLGETRPDELDHLLDTRPEARQAWQALSAAQRRDFVLFVAAARKPETRARRAARLLR